MAADPIVYCLEHVTDDDQFERLCHDLMALDGYRHIEPLGGHKDKGRDAIHIDRQTNSQVDTELLLARRAQLERRKAELEKARQAK